jgi:hypothetical protein
MRELILFFAARVKTTCRVPVLECRTYGAQDTRHPYPALPGWAHVWRSALRALTNYQLAHSIIPS